jgi:peptidoglycan/xylan/chitin deacetylase (PgdA/CDA1 family)
MHWIWSLVAGLTAQQVRTRQGGAQRTLFLTFDDGPHPTVTPSLLDVLARHQAKATFFLLGNNAKAHPDIVARIVKEGHVIANHSMTHPSFRALSRADQLAEVAQADEVLARFDGRARHAFRPPRGHATPTMIVNALLGRQPMVLWSFDSLDFKLELDDLTARLQAYQPKAGEILLFHDDMPRTVAALDQLLPLWRAAGFEFAAT